MSQPSLLSESSYQGSQAFNQLLLASEQVNSNTGSLIFTKPIVNLNGLHKLIDLNINLIYSFGSKGILGLPNNWGLGIVYLIPGTSLTWQGGTHIVDPNWADEGGYQSGLRYVNNHGVKFREIIPPQPLPSGNPGEYSYQLTCESGTNYYFDALGKLLEKADRFGNHINYYYTDQFGGIFNNYLDYIVDSYGQKIVFSYGPNAIIVTLPNGAKTTINFSSRGVENILDGAGYITIFQYSTVSNNVLITEIDYPSGLKSQIQYTSITYQTDSGTQGAFPAVSELIHLDTNKLVLERTQYTYGYATAGNTFTGYNAGYKLSATNDGLMDSNNTGYLYDILIKKLDNTGNLLSASAIYYNFLHLPVEVDQYVVQSDGRTSNGFRSTYTYEISPDWHARTTNYNKPIEIEQLVWSEDSKSYLPINKTTNGYDVFGKILSNETALYQSDHKSLASQVKTSHTYTVTSWGDEMPQKVTVEDLVSGLIKETEYSLTNDQKNIASQVYRYQQKTDKALRPWKTNQYEYDKQGRLISSTLTWSKGSSPDPNSILTTSENYQYNFDANAFQLEVVHTDALGQKTVNTFDVKLPKCPLIKSISPLGRIVTCQYDPVGRLIQQTDPAGHIDKITYTVASKDGYNSQCSTDPIGYQSMTYYDALGRPIKVMDNGDPTKAELKDINRVLEQTTYNTLGKISQKVDILGLKTTYQYDSLGRQVRMVDPYENVLTTNYEDVQFIATHLINNEPHSLVQKDGLGRILLTERYSDTSDSKTNYYLCNSFQYNGLGQKTTSVLSTIEKNSHKIISKIYQQSWQYNNDNQISEIQFTGYVSTQVQITEQYVYDLLGQLLHSNKNVSYTDGHSYSVKSDIWKYNKLGQLITTINALKQEEKVTYNADGNLSTRTRLDGSVFTYDYDPNGNLLSINWEENKTSCSIKHYYDELNRLIKLTEGSITQAFAYNLDGTLKSVTYPQNHQQIYSYDNYSRLIKQKDVSGATTTYSYNEKGQLAAVKFKNDSITYQYATINHIHGELSQSKLEGHNEWNYIYQYDGFGRLNSTQVLNSTKKSILNTLYNHDALGRLTQLIQSSEINSDKAVNFSRTHTYDGLNQLIAVKTIYQDKKYQPENLTYTYDGNHNILLSTKQDKTETYQYNAIDQLLKPGIKYDSNGRMVQDDQGYLYSYNLLDQLTTITGLKGEPIVTYRYYPDGLLATRLENTKTEQFYYAGGTVNAIASIKNNQNNAQWTTFLLHGRERLAAYEDTLDPYYYLSAQGSTVQAISGQSIESLDYEPYGAGINVSDSANPNIGANKSFTWNQEYNDPSVNLVYLRSRFYHPRLRRFITSDSYPLYNKYAFGVGDPINRIDPSGHLSVLNTVLDSIGIVLGIAAVAVSGGSSLALASGLLGLGSSAAGLISDTTGSKGASTASLVLGIVGIGFDAASFAISRAGRVASRISTSSNNSIELGEMEEKVNLLDRNEIDLSRARSLLRSGPIFIGEKHDLPDGTDFISSLIDEDRNNRNINGISMEIQSTSINYDGKQFSNKSQVTNLNELHDAEFMFSSLKRTANIRYYDIAEQAVKNNIPVYFHDIGPSRDIRMRNLYAKNFLNGLQKYNDNGGKGFVILGGIAHFRGKKPLQKLLNFNDDSRLFNFCPE